MAFGKSNRMDGRRASSSYCSTTTIVVFVALCLVGVWMMTSTTVVPVEMSSQGTTKNPVTETDSPQSEDRSSDVTEDFVKEGDGGNIIPDESNTETSVGQNLQENTEKLEGKTQEESPLKRKEEEGNTQAFNDANGNSEGEETVKEGGDDKHEGDESDGGEKKDDENSKRSENDEEQQSGEKKLEQEELSDSETRQDEKGEDQVEKVEHIEDKEPSSKTKEVFPDGAQSELLNETSTQNGAWSTQAAESKSEKEKQASSLLGNQQVYSWQLCNVTSGPDYIPCLDNEKAIKKLHSTKHYQHRERHCPEQPPTCLVPLPDGYKRSLEWPNSRDKIWYYNVPHTKLAVVKGHQNWVKVSGEYLTFPGGGTQFKHGALHYIDFIQRSHSGISWGKQSRTVLDVGCGVASFGGYLFDRDVLAMSFAPKDEHEAQVQFALERGIPAISAVMGTKRLPFPSGVFDIVHCARCRVPWHIEGGMLLLELNRLLRPGGYFVWSATPVYQNLTEDVEIWNAMSALTKSMCWKMVNKTKDKLNEVGLAIFRKPTDNKCYESRTEENPPLCQESDDPDAAWNVPLQACMHKVAIRGSQWPEQWPRRLETSPYWINNSQVGVYGKPASEDFVADYEHWKRVVTKSYVNGMGINWSNVRNVMDMRSIYGGFAAALRDMKVWVMNIVSIDSPDTLPIIYDRGLFGMYHDWCESFSTYPRTYDLLHADHLFTKLKKRCKLLPVFVEMDRILRPEGKLIIRDTVETITEIERMAKSMQWEVRMTYSKDNEGLLCLQKTMWRPKEVEASM